MHTNNLAALGAGPSFLFVSNKMSYAKLPYAHEIVNHTHAILGSIPLIQVIQPVARKTAHNQNSTWLYPALSSHSS